jgi:hypothetical protein
MQALEQGKSVYGKGLLRQRRILRIDMLVNVVLFTFIDCYFLIFFFFLKPHLYHIFIQSHVTSE